MTTEDKLALRIMRLDEVKEKTGLGRSAIYDRMGKGTFPSSVKLGARSVGWLENEIDGWLISCIENRTRSANINWVGGEI